MIKLISIIVFKHVPRNHLDQLSVTYTITGICAAHASRANKLSAHDVNPECTFLRFPKIAPLRVDKSKLLSLPSPPPSDIHTQFGNNIHHCQKKVPPFTTKTGANRGKLSLAAAAAALLLEYPINVNSDFDFNFIVRMGVRFRFRFISNVR